VKSYLLRRLAGAVPLLLGVATLVFIVVNLAPGDPSTALLRPGVSAEILEQTRSNFGLDRPLHVRYLKWLGAFFTGDFGYSYSHRLPVADVLRDVLPHTLLLSGAALVGAFFVGILVGVVQAVRQGTLTDSVLSVVTLVFYSMPSFWLALMMILVFALLAGTVWDWPVHFPVSGARDIAASASMSPWERWVDRAYHLVLPATTLVLVISAGIARFTRSSMLEVVRQDYVRTARAKALPESTVVVKHALRNALIPVITLLGLYLPVLFSGTVFVETVFEWPGMGRTMVEAIARRDYPLVMAGSFLFALMVVIGNLLADVLYAVADPRIRRG
jgi:peptide/nickel transport system permease protein